MKTMLATLALTLITSTSLFTEELDPASLETFRPYQLDICLISEDVIGGEMGEGISLVYKGQEVTFCCKPCIREFASDPGKYMEIMAKKEAEKAAAEEAAAEATGEGEAKKGKHDHGEHKESKKGHDHGHHH